MEETQRRHCEAPIRFVAAEAISRGLVGKARGASPGPAAPATTRPVWSRSGQSTRAFPHIRGAQVVFNEWSGAAAPLLCQRRLGPQGPASRRPTAFGNGALASAREVRAPRADAECRRAPLHLWVQVASRNRLKRAGPGGISHLRHPGESRSPGRIEKCLKWTVFERVSQQAQAVLRWAEAISRAW